MEVYIQAIINFQRNDLTKLLPIARFAYNNTKNISTGYMAFVINSSLYPQAYQTKDVNL